VKISLSAPLVAEYQESRVQLFLLVINETPLFPSNAEFNRISSVLAKCRFWRETHAFKAFISLPPHHFLPEFVTFSSRPAYRIPPTVHGAFLYRILSKA